ncbi:hypothetical protein Celaphus_00016152, partial [Cervus elaphus hippelaphus]
AIGLLTVTSKGCSSHCVEDARNSFGSKKNACCCTNLSNASGAHALQLAGVTSSLLAALGRLGPGPAVGSRRTLLCPMPGSGVQGPGEEETRFLSPRPAEGAALHPTPHPPTGTALQCYSCEDQGNNKGCQCVQNCRTIAGPSAS